MAEALKHVFNNYFYDALTGSMAEKLSHFDDQSFRADIFVPGWEDLELKERMRHTSLVLDGYLTGTFPEKANLVVSIVEHMIERGYQAQSLELMFFPDFIEVFGLEYYEAAVGSFEKITKITSCEFAVRPFLLKYPDLMLEQMKAWSGHDHPQVRRLSSEGSRPRLPWAMAIPYLKHDPSPILPILENLRDDPAETVRRSVANSLNDISKDNPVVTIELARRWQGHSAERDWVVKHACRTLLKQGNKAVLPLFGFGSTEDIRITDFNILTPTVRIGESLVFQFSVVNNSSDPCRLRVEYGLYYLKANGSLSKKVFMIGERTYPVGSSKMINRKQSFKPITTRRFYTGMHGLSIIINGEELVKRDFELR
jgi:3-methyladenine DNA glycosylase AlkC